MRLTWPVLAAALLLGVTACKGFSFPWFKTDPVNSRSVESSDGGIKELPRVRLELQDLRYDGWSLSGRLLVSPDEGRLRLDKRLITSASLSTKSVTDCVTRHPVEFMVIDVRATGPQEEDVLLLESGYWYGKDVRIPLFAETPDRQRGPNCIEVDMVFHALGGAPVARVHVRAESQPLPPVDLGMSADAGIRVDAGL